VTAGNHDHDMALLFHRMAGAGIRGSAVCAGGFEAGVPTGNRQERKGREGRYETASYAHISYKFKIIY
jgi:hypothetical protein